MDTTKPLVITISRQLGSGGAYVGQQLAKQLNLRYLDREIIRLAAEKLSMLEEDLQLRDEKMLSFWESFLHFTAMGSEAYTPPKIISLTDRELFKIQSEIISRVAAEQPSVVMGRCGFHVLKDHPNRVSIYLHADAQFRSRRVQELYKISNKEAARLVEKNDKERDEYISTFIEGDWWDARLFDLCIDTSKIGVDNSLELILNYLKMR